MSHQIVLYTASALTAIWGLAHLFPTSSVVRGFGADNRRIITMEWILEGAALLWMGALVATVTAIDATTVVSRAVYLVSSAGLLVFAFWGSWYLEKNRERFR